MLKIVMVSSAAAAAVAVVVAVVLITIVLTISMFRIIHLAGDIDLAIDKATYADVLPFMSSGIDGNGHGVSGRTRLLFRVK